MRSCSLKKLSLFLAASSISPHRRTFTIEFSFTMTVPNSLTSDFVCQVEASRDSLR